MHEIIIVAKKTMLNAFRQSNFCDLMLGLFMILLSAISVFENILRNMLMVAFAPC